MIRTYKAVPEASGSNSRDLAASLGIPWRETGMPKLVIGRREWISLPELGVSPLNAKTDSGARSSSIHAEEVELSEDERSVRFITVTHYNERITCEAPVARIARVRSSTGKAKKRIFIQTTAMLPGGFSWSILISLANRSVMLCPMLLGRRALSGYFLIDPQGAHLLGPRRQLPGHRVRPKDADRS
ncbi:MAG: RimK/LysX family protein [Luteolibacter sp.]